MSRLLRCAVSAGLLALVIAFADWRAIWAVLREVDLVWVAGGALFSLVDRVISNYRWQMFLAARNVVPGFWQLFRVQLAANFLGSFLPSSIGVDAVRIAALCRQGQAAAPVIAATLIDRISIALAALLTGSAMILALAGTRVPQHIAAFVYLFTALGILAAALFLHPAARRWAAVVLLPRVPERFRRTVADAAAAALGSRCERRTLVALGVATVVLLAVRILFAKAVALACGVDIPFSELLLVIPILWIVVMLPITIGGFGVQDAGYVVLMALIGVGAPVAVSMSLIEHIVARAVTLPGALFLDDIAGTAARRVVAAGSAVADSPAAERGAVAGRPAARADE